MIMHVTGQLITFSSQSEKQSCGIISFLGAEHDGQMAAMSYTDI
jgi:hypothetical protein